MKAKIIIATVLMAVLIASFVIVEGADEEPQVYGCPSHTLFEGKHMRIKCDVPEVGEGYHQCGDGYMTETNQDQASEAKVVQMSNDGCCGDMGEGNWGNSMKSFFGSAEAASSCEEAATKMCGSEGGYEVIKESSMDLGGIICDKNGLSATIKTEGSDTPYKLKGVNMEDGKFTMSADSEMTIGEGESKYTIKNVVGDLEMDGDNLKSAKLTATEDMEVLTLPGQRITGVKKGQRIDFADGEWTYDGAEGDSLTIQNVAEDGTRGAARDIAFGDGEIKIDKDNNFNCEGYCGIDGIKIEGGSGNLLDDRGLLELDSGVATVGAGPGRSVKITPDSGETINIRQVDTLSSSHDDAHVIVGNNEIRMWGGRNYEVINVDGTKWDVDAGTGDSVVNFNYETKKITGDITGGSSYQLIALGKDGEYNKNIVLLDSNGFTYDGVQQDMVFVVDENLANLNGYDIDVTLSGHKVTTQTTPDGLSFQVCSDCNDCSFKEKIDQWVGEKWDKGVAFIKGSDATQDFQKLNIESVEEIKRFNTFEIIDENGDVVGTVNEIIKNDGSWAQTDHLAHSIEFKNWQTSCQSEGCSATTNTFQLTDEELKQYNDGELELQY